MEPWKLRRCLGKKRDEEEAQVLQAEGMASDKGIEIQKCNTIIKKKRHSELRAYDTVQYSPIINIKAGVEDEP